MNEEENMNEQMSVQPCGHPATAYVDRPSWGWCSICAQQAEAALPAPAPAKPVPRAEEGEE